jgi:hypothetical protein
MSTKCAVNHIYYKPTINSHLISVLFSQLKEDCANITLECVLEYFKENILLIYVDIFEGKRNLTLLKLD